MKFWKLVAVIVGSAALFAIVLPLADGNSWTHILSADSTVSGCSTVGGQSTVGGESTVGGQSGVGGESIVCSPSATMLTTTLTAPSEPGGAAISVPAGTDVTDTATLSGTNAAVAGGTVTYNIYSDDTCSTLVAGGGTVVVCGGERPSLECGGPLGTWHLLLAGHLFG